MGGVGVGVGVGGLGGLDSLRGGDGFREDLELEIELEGLEERAGQFERPGSPSGAGGR